MGLDGYVHVQHIYSAFLMFGMLDACNRKDQYNYRILIKQFIKINQHSRLCPTNQLNAMCTAVSLKNEGHI